MGFELSGENIQQKNINKYHDITLLNIRKSE